MHPSPYNSRLQEAQPPAPAQNEVPVPAVHGCYSAEKEGPVVLMGIVTTVRGGANYITENMDQWLSAPLALLFQLCQDGTQI